jgi:FdhD protein
MNGCADRGRGAVTVVAPVIRVSCSVWSRQGAQDGDRVVPEAGVAFVYDGSCYAVTMATPQDLEDFAFGFSITEGIVSSPEDIRHLEIVEEDVGIELRMWLSGSCSAALHDRQLHLAGPAGAGLRGLEVLADASRPPPRVRDGQLFTPVEVMRALDALGRNQALNRQTHGVHGAAFWEPSLGLVAVREDVARNAALDKLAGALACDRVPSATGMVLLTSHVSADTVRKAAVLGAPALVATSAPTAFAVRTAESVGITLVALARSDGFEIFTHPRRITKEAAAYVA